MVEKKDMEDGTIDIVAYVARHSLQMTMDLYCHVEEDTLKEEMRSWRKWCKSGVVEQMADEESAYLSHIMTKHLKFVIFQVSDEL
jgi:hypothetical protein